MDCGYQFADRLEKEKTLHKGCFPADMIRHIYNWGVLGSGLFSKWRYFTHWANASLEKDIDWFILVLHQLYKKRIYKSCFLCPGVFLKEVERVHQPLLYRSSNV